MNSIKKVFAALIALLLIVVMLQAAGRSTTKGKLQAVYPDKQEFVLESGQGQARTFKLDAMGKVTINNEEAQLADLLAGEEVTVIYELQGGFPLASEVRCIRFQIRQHR
jgi:hypothetical protein